MRLCASLKIPTFIRAADWTYKGDGISVDIMAAYYTFEDLSGNATKPSTTTSDNPYDGLIESCEDDAVSTIVNAER